MARFAVAALFVLPPLGAAWTLVWALGLASAAGTAAPTLVVRGEPVLSAVPAAAPLEEPGEPDEAARAQPRGAVALERFAFRGYDPPELRVPPGRPLALDEFPEHVRELAGRAIVIEGFPLAVELAGREVASVILTRYPPGCCFGSVPVLDEWIEARLEPGAAARLSPYEPARVRGVLEVGEERDDDGFAVSLYRLRDARVE